MRRNVLVSSTSSLVNGPPYLLLAQVYTAWNILLPVGEGTTMLRDLVVPRILEHFVDILEWVETCSQNV